MNWTDVYDMTKVQRIVLLKGGNNYLLDELSRRKSNLIILRMRLNPISQK